VKEAGLTGGCAKAKGNLLYTVASKVCLASCSESVHVQVGGGGGSGGGGDVEA
jgi:hypothetical protein